MGGAGRGAERLEGMGTRGFWEWQRRAGSPRVQGQPEFPALETKSGPDWGGAGRMPVNPLKFPTPVGWLAAAVALPFCVLRGPGADE